MTIAKIKFFPFIIFLFFSLTSCTSFVETSYDSIATTNYTVNKLMEKAGKAYKNDKLNDNQRNEIISIYKKFRSASDTADEALADYAENKTTRNKHEYLAALELLNERKSKLKSLIKEFLNDQQGN